MPGPKYKTITRRELANRVSKTHGIPIRKARAIIAIIFSVLQLGLVNDKEVNLPGLGTLSLHKAPSSIKLWRLNKIVIQYKDEQRIVFKPDKLW